MVDYVIGAAETPHKILDMFGLAAGWMDGRATPGRCGIPKTGRAGRGRREEVKNAPSYYH